MTEYNRNYQGKRREFAENITFNGEIKHPNDKKEERRPEQEYRVKKSYRRMSKEEQRELAREKLIQRVKTTAVIVGLSGALVIGGKACSNMIEDRNCITIEQALENGKTPEDLAISQEVIDEIRDMEETVNREDVTYEELTKLAVHVPDVQIDILKQKIRKATGVDDITLYYSEIYGNSVVKVEKEEYPKNNIVRQQIGKTISSDIAKYIKEIADAQTMEEKMVEGAKSPKDAKKYYKKVIERMSQVATWEIQADEKENISVEKTTKSELEKDNNDEYERE